MRYDRVIKKVFIGAVLLIGLAFIGASQSNAQTDSVAGEWDAEMSHPGGVSNFKLVFEVDGEKLTGIVKRSSGDSELTGTVKGSDLKFSYAITYGGNSLTMLLTGKVDGDSITGVVYFGDSGQSSDWSAKRAGKD